MHVGQEYSIQPLVMEGDMPKKKQKKGTQASPPKKSSQSKSSQPSSQPAKSSQALKGPQPVRKERTALWAIIIVLIGIHGLVAAALAYASLNPAYKQYMPVAVALFVLASLAAIVAAVGMWYWKKWSLALYLITVAVACAVHIVFTGSLLFAFVDILPVLVVGYTLKFQNLLRFYE
jgi:hypothetical protein